MKFDKILATSQSRTKAPTEDTVIEESRIIKDNAEIPLTDIDFYSDNNVAQPFNIDEEELNRAYRVYQEHGTAYACHCQRA